MQGLFRFRKNIGSFQYPVPHRPAKTTREHHRLPLKNSAEPRAQGLGERRIEVAFEPERCACAVRFDQRLRDQRCALRRHPRVRRRSLAAAGAAAHHEPARRACNLAVMMKGATDQRRPSLSHLAPVRLSGRRPPPRDALVPVSGANGERAQRHLGHGRAVSAAATLDPIVVGGSVR